MKSWRVCPTSRSKPRLRAWPPTATHSHIDVLEEAVVEYEKRMRLTHRVLEVSETRSARVAFLVYNDVHADTRVVKTALTLREAGADVRIFAIASGPGGYAPGLVADVSGIEIFRLALPDAKSVLPPRWSKWLTSRLTPQPRS